MCKPARHAGKWSPSRLGRETTLPVRYLGEASPCWAGRERERETESPPSTTGPLEGQLSPLMLPSSLLLLRRAFLRPTTSSVAYTAQGGPSMAKPVEASIRAKLQKALEPVHLEVINDSHMHSVPRGSETHFRVVVASGRFEGLSMIHRHRLVNDILQEELAGPIHALSIQAKTPQQWEKNPRVIQASECLGGSKHDPQISGKAEKTGLA